MPARLAALIVGLLAIAASPAEAAPRAWDLANDFRTGSSHANPNPDSHGNLDVWSFSESATLVRDPATYTRLPDYDPAYCGTAGAERWLTGSRNTPHIGKNANSSPVSPCSSIPELVWPPGAVVAHPSISRLAVVEWKSPFTGAVSISGAVADAESGAFCGDGIGWTIDKGPGDRSSKTTLASGSFGDGGSQQFDQGSGGGSLSSVAVQQGENLYFVIDPGSFLNEDCDSTVLAVTISELEPSGGTTTTPSTSASPPPPPPPPPPPAPEPPPVPLVKARKAPNLCGSNVDAARQELLTSLYATVLADGRPKKDVVRMVGPDMKCPNGKEIRPNDIFTQAPRAGQTVHTSPARLSPVTVSYYDPDLDCADYLKLGGGAGRYLRRLYHEAVADLESEHCRYEVDRFVPSETVAEPRLKSAVGRLSTRKVHLEVLWPKTADLSAVVFEGVHKTAGVRDLSLEACGSGCKSNWRAMASATNGTAFSVMVRENRTGRLVTEAELDLIDPDGKVVQSRRTDASGANNKQDLDSVYGPFRVRPGVLRPGRYSLRIRAGSPRGLTEDGYAYIQVDREDRSKPFVTIAGEELRWSARAKEWTRPATRAGAAFVRARAAGVLADSWGPFGRWLKGLLSALTGQPVGGGSSDGISLAPSARAERATTNTAARFTPCANSPGRELRGRDPRQQQVQPEAGAALTLAVGTGIGDVALKAPFRADGLPTSCIVFARSGDGAVVDTKDRLGASQTVSGDANVIAVGGGHWEARDHELVFDGLNLIDVDAGAAGQVIGVGSGHFLDFATGHVINVGAGHMRDLNTGAVIAVGAGNVIAVGSGNVIATGAGHFIDPSNGHVIAVGAGHFVHPRTGQVINVGAGHAVDVTAQQVVNVGHVVNVGAGHVINVGAGHVVNVGSGHLQPLRATGRVINVGAGHFTETAVPAAVLAAPRPSATMLNSRSGQALLESGAMRLGRVPANVIATGSGH